MLAKTGPTNFILTVAVCVAGRVKTQPRGNGSRRNGPKLKLSIYRTGWVIPDQDFRVDHGLQYRIFNRLIFHPLLGANNPRLKRSSRQHRPHI